MARGGLRHSPPVVGFAAAKGAGKTTLLLKLMPVLIGRGLRLGVIKRAHPSFDIDKPGTDSYALRKAGAAQILINSEQRWALMVENNPPGELTLFETLTKLDTETLDLVLVEGFKESPIPKIELHRPSMGHELMAPRDPDIIAVATDRPDLLDCQIPILDLNEASAIADFLCARLELIKVG